MQALFILSTVFKITLHWFIQQEQNCVLNGGEAAWGCSGSQYEGSWFESRCQSLHVSVSSWVL